MNRRAGVSSRPAKAASIDADGGTGDPGRELAGEGDAPVRCHELEDAGDVVSLSARAEVRAR